MKSSLFKRYGPIFLVSILEMLLVYFCLKAFVNIVLVFRDFIRKEPSHLAFFGDPVHPSLTGLVIIFMVGVSTWLMSTKVKRFKTIGWRLLFFMSMVFSIVLYYVWLITVPVYNYLIPFLEHRASLVNMSSSKMEEVIVGNTTNMMLLFLSIPGLFVILLVLWMSKLYTKHHEPILEWFKEYEYKSSKLQWMFKNQEVEQYPDVILGPSKDSKELIIQKGRDRTLNNAIVGPIGTGKTSSLILPIINQDLTWMARFINAFPKIHSKGDFHTERVKGVYMNGISVIEPSNDLCQKAYQLAIAHNIPDEAIWYFDPTNPDTPSINPFKGPVDKVAEAVTMVIEGIGENNNFFFQQSQRSHLKNYIYLMKLHNPSYTPKFQDLISMYSNAQVVRRMHLQLKETIPDNYLDITERDLRNHWSIVKGVDEWFDANLLPEVQPRTLQPILVTEGEFRGQQKYYDAEREFVKGLRNILDDMSTNILLRRVLFEESDFDFDTHLETGGVLLVNTAKGELGALSNVLGKFILLSLQNAVFRREPNVSPFHHIVIDEFPDYIYEPFTEFPTQSRKYKTIITIATQTLSQLSRKFSEHYMQSLLGALRHKMVFGDLTPFDARLFSDQFGEEDVYEEGNSEQVISPMQENPSNRQGITYTKRRKPIMSPEKLIYQDRFECAVKLVQDNRPIKVQQITSNFIPKEEFIKAKVTVNKESAKVWLSERARWEEAMANESLIQKKDTDLDVTPKNIEVEQSQESGSGLFEEEASPTLDDPDFDTDVDRMLQLDYGRQPVGTVDEQPGMPPKSRRLKTETIPGVSQPIKEVESLPLPRIRTNKTHVSQQETVHDTSWENGLFDQDPDQPTFSGTIRPVTPETKDQPSSVVKPEVSVATPNQKQMVDDLLNELYSDHDNVNHD